MQKNSSAPPNSEQENVESVEQEKEEEIKAIEQEIEMLQDLDLELNEAQMQRLFFLLDQLSELRNIPDFDVKEGWEEFERYYLPIVEELRKREQARKQRKLNFARNIINVSFIVVFTFAFVGGATGRTGFVNYFTRSTQETEVISGKSREQIQDEIEREYKTLEKEYGIKLGKLNLSSDNYNLQDYVLSEKYMHIEYLDINTGKNIVFSIYKNKQSSGEINVESSNIAEIYLYKNVEYTIIQNMEHYDISWEKQGIYYILQNCNSVEEGRNIVESIVY